MTLEAGRNDLQGQRLFTVGKRSLACAGLFALAAATVHVLDVRGNYYAQQSYVYALYNTCKVVLAGLTFLLAVTAGDLLLRLRARSAEALGPDALTRFFLGVCAIQVTTFILGCFGLLYWQLLVAAAALLLSLSEAAVVEFLAQVRTRLGRLLRLAGRVPLAFLPALRSGEHVAAAAAALATLVFWALLAQLLVLFVIFGILPNDQVNDIHAVTMPYLTDVQTFNTLLLPRIFLIFFSLKGAGFGIFMSQIADPYFWQLSMFVLYAGAILALAEGLRLTLPGLRLLRAVTLLIFSGAMLFKFNQTALHAAHTYYVFLLMYVFIRRHRAAGTTMERQYSFAVNIMLVGCALLDPKLGFFLYMLVLADASFAWRRGRLPLGRVALGLTLPVATTLALLWINFATTGMADMFLRPLTVFDDMATVRTWMSDGLYLYTKEFFAAAFEVQRPLSALVHATKRIYGGQELAVVHLVSLALIWVWRKRFSSVFLFSFLMASALLFMGIGLCTWQANEAIIRFVYLLEPESVLLKALLMGLAFAFIKHRLRRLAVVALSAALLLTLKPHNSLVAPGWLTVDSADTRQASLAIRDYPYKVFDLGRLSTFFLRGTLLSAHTAGGFPPAEPYAALKAMEPDTFCLVLGYVPQAYAMPGNRFLLDFHTPFNNIFDSVAFGEAATAAAALKRNAVEYLYLDVTEPFFNLSNLLYADLFQPDQIWRYYTLVHKGPHSYLLKLNPGGNASVDKSFREFYERFYAISQREEKKSRHQRIREMLRTLRSKRVISCLYLPSYGYDTSTRA